MSVSAFLQNLNVKSPANSDPIGDFLPDSSDNPYTPPASSLVYAWHPATAYGDSIAPSAEGNDGILSSSITPSATGTLVNAGGMTFDLLFSTDAPTAFRNGIIAAATMLSKAISDKITVNLTINYSGTGGGASAKPDNGQYLNYNTVRDDLINNETAGDTTFAALPTGASIQGQSTVAVFNTQLKLWGVLGANDTSTDDGEATFATDIPDDDLVGVALHELTHAIGRVPYGPQPDVFDLYRFTGVGTRLFTSSIPSSAAYFSIDGGETKLADFGVKSDPSDFLNSGVQGADDAFNEFYDSTTNQYLSGVDLEILDSLGFNVKKPSSLSIGLADDTGVSATDGVTFDDALTGSAAANSTVTLSENGATLGTALASAAGVWSFTPTLADGVHTITVSQSGATASATFTLATRAPSLSATESVTGATTQTSDTIVVTSAAEAEGANAIVKVEVYDGNADLGAATYLNGKWSLAASNLLAGAHNFSVKATDSAGNVASTSLPTVTVGGGAPPVNSTFTLSDFTFTGSGVTTIRPKGINDLGEIVGYYIDSRPDNIGADGNTYYEHGFYSTVSGTTRSYYTLDDPEAPIQRADGQTLAPVRTRAYAVNDKGDIAGWYSPDELAESSDGSTYVEPDAGFLASTSITDDFSTLAFAPLNNLGTHAIGMNANDQIVGYYDDGSGEEHGFLRDFNGYNVRGTYISFDPAGSINTVAEGVNDSGEIVGYYEKTDQTYHSFAYNSSTGVFTPIDFNGATSTEALGVNDGGEVVGAYFDSSGKRHGFVRSASGQFETIDDSEAGAGGTLVGGINNLGEIVGWYTNASGEDVGFTGAPAAPVLAVSGVSGAASVTLSGTVDAFDTGDAIAVYDGATLLNTVYAATSGVWTATVSVTSTGEHTLYAHAANAAAGSYTQNVVDLVNATASLSGGGQIALFGTTGDTLSLSATAGVWDTVTGSSGTLNLTKASVSVIGGGDKINTDNTSADQASLYNTNGVWDTVYGSNGQFYLTNAYGSFQGGGDAIYLITANSIASLYATGSNWDTVYGSNAQVYLTGAYASVVGGGDTVNLTTANSIVSVYATNGNWDSIYGSSAQVYVTAALASVLGGGDILYVATPSSSVGASSVSLYNTKGVWDAVYASNAQVYLTGAYASILGGGDAINLMTANSIVSVYATNGNWDTIYASGDQMYVTAAQASVLGGGDTINVTTPSSSVGASSVSLYNTKGVWDTVYATGDTVNLTNAQATVIGGGDVLYSASGSSFTLLNTGQNADAVFGSSDAINLSNANAAVTGNNDTLYFAGTDALALSGGGELLAFAAQYGVDAISNFAASDKLQLSAADWANYSVFTHSHAMTQVGGDTVITLGANKITLYGVQASTLSSANFSFV